MDDQCKEDQDESTGSKNLEASIKTKTGAIHAIEDISFSMEKGRSWAL